MSAKYVKSVIPGKDIAIYAGARVTVALKLINEMDVFAGVKMIDLMEAVYEQGKKDGAADAFAAIQVASKKAMSKATKSIPHKNPGRPKGSIKVTVL